MGSFSKSRSVISGKLIATRTAVNNLGANGSIPITATMVNVDANGSEREGIRFGGTGTAGQIIFVNNTGDDDLRFHGDEETALLRGVADEFDMIETTGVYMFASDGALWNYIGGGADAGGGLGDSS